jgi:hypothetical protein
LSEIVENPVKMTSRSKKKWIVAALSVAALLLLAVYELFFGRLFPFSPVVIGFSREERDNCVVYHHGQPELPQLSYLSDVVTMEEKYHGMSFGSKPEIFFCKNDSEFRRLSGGKARFIAINGRVFVLKHAQEDARQGQIDLRTYLTHEMSHGLLQQHMSLLRCAKMPRWLVEGVAMDCAGQVGIGVYPAKSEVYQAVAQDIFCEPADYGTFLSGERGTAISCPLTNKSAFFYSQFGCMVEFLRSSYGTQRFQAFLMDVVKSHSLSVEDSFEAVFGESLADEVARFKNETKKPTALKRQKAAS